MLRGSTLSVVNISHISLLSAVAYQYHPVASISVVIQYCPNSIFPSHILPILMSLSERCTTLQGKEKLLFSCMAATSDMFVIQNQKTHTKVGTTCIGIHEIIIQCLAVAYVVSVLQELQIFSRDVTAIMKIVYKFLKSLELSLIQTFGPIHEHDVVTSLCNILDYYYSSQRFASQLDHLKKTFFSDSSIVDTRGSFFNTLLLCGDALLKSLQPTTVKQIDQFQSLFTGVSTCTYVYKYKL